MNIKSCKKGGNLVMLMDIRCSAVTSVKVNLTFDDHSTKECVVATGDLISVEYNANGMRKHIDGKVLRVSAVGTDPKGWYILVDGSDDFESERAKFSPMSILDIEIIRKADTLEVVKTIVGEGGIPYIRIKRGRLQWSADGYNWRPINIDRRDIIEEAEGPIDDYGHQNSRRDFDRYDDPEPSNDDEIEDADW